MSAVTTDCAFKPSINEEVCDGHIDGFVEGAGIFFTANEGLVAHEVLSLICKSCFD